MKTPGRKPLRLWPGVVIAILQCVVSFGAPVVRPDDTLLAVFAGPVGTLAIVLWWVFFSRAPWAERLGAVGLMVAGLFATSRIIDKSDRGARALVPHVGDTVPGPRPGRVVRGHASSRGRTSARDDGRDHPARLWSVGAGPDRWLHRQQLP